MLIRSTKSQGFTMVEAVLVSTMLAIVGAAVMSSSIAALRALNSTKLHTAAINQIQQQMESLRGMDFFRIGIHSDDGVGYVNHTVDLVDKYDASEDVLMSTVVTLSEGRTTNSSDDVTATMVTYVSYVDDAYDGIGDDDADGQTNDYKQILVQVDWEFRSRQFSRSGETFLYGITGDDSGYDGEGAGDEPSGAGDPPGFEITKAEYKKGKKELKVEVVDNEDGVPVFTVVGYGFMEYEPPKDKHKYKKKNVDDPGSTVTVVSDSGFEVTCTVKVKA